MKELEFGISIAVIGMGGTFAALGLLVLAIEVLKKILPYKPPVKTGEGK